MVTVVKTPQGHKIIDQAISANIIDGGITAFVVFPYHGMADGDYVYITSDIDEYNGFWYVTVINEDNFRISEHADADYVEYYQDAEVEYYQTQPHEWSSIFLPIVYKCTNNRWPLNEIDTPRTVSSASDDNGFTRLALSGDIRFGTANILDFVRITGASDDDLNTVWQIVEVNDQDDITINLPYDVANSFTGADVQFYYANYQVRVKIWAGLNLLHPWQPKKPFEEMAELSLTPDENGEVMFSVADYIKSKVAIKNNLTLFSLPLNLDAFTGFYIQTGESYDESDNYSLYTTDPVFQTDDFQGYAIAGKLPFKNVYSGDYADYVYTDGSPALWLTNADRLLAVEDLYFDISFIKNIAGSFQVIIDKYISDYLSAIETVDYVDQGIGVYRIPITADTYFDSFCVRAVTEAHSEEMEIIETEEFDLSTWINDSQGLTDWTTGIAHPYVDLLGNNSEHLHSPYATTAGQVYRYNYEFLIESSDPGTKTVQILFLDAGYLAVGFSYINAVGDGILSGFVDITPSSPGTYIAVSGSSIGLAWDIIVNEISVDTIVTSIVEVPAATLTEEICIDLLEQCEAEQGFTAEDARLLEDGDFRLLE